MALIVLVVVVLVLRGVADNFAAGVLMQTRQAVKIGDEIQVEGPDGAITGVVTELNSRAVLLRTVDGRTVHIPKARLLGDPLVNHSTHAARRSEVQARIARGGRSIVELLSLVTEAAGSVEGVHRREFIGALPTAISPERLTARVQFWHHPLRGVPITAEVVATIAEALEASGIEGTVTSGPGPAPLIPPERI